MNPSAAESAKAPVVSVIVPSYKVRGFIAVCVRSLFNQTFKEGYEIIIVDDGDPDASVQDVKAIEHEKPANATLRYLEHGCNRGVSAARNTGTGAARGEYVIYVDSDDETYPNMLEDLVSEARQTGADVTVGVAREVPPINGKEFRPYTAGRFSNEEAFPIYMDGYIDSTPWNKLVRREFIERKNIAFPVGVRYEDELWNSDVLLAGATYACIDRPTYLYNAQREGSFMSATQQARFAQLITYSNTNAESLDAHGYKDELLAHRRLASSIIVSTQQIFLNTPRSNFRESWKLCRRMAEDALEISPAFRHHLTRSEFGRTRIMGRLLHLPTRFLRKNTLVFFFLIVALRVRPAV